jgi:hypothetical protein
MLQGLDREIRQLVRDNPEAEPSAIGEAAEEAVHTIVAQAIKSKELARQRGSWWGAPHIWIVGVHCSFPAHTRTTAKISLLRLRA